jgi:GT2 family glycosyltransferase
MSTSEARATIVVVPRDRFGVTQRSLESVLAHTEPPFELVYVDGGSPRPVRAYLEAEAEAWGFTLVRTEEYLPPNRARNLGSAHVATEYTVFVDNDVVVTDAWLSALVGRADATAAWVVGPLYLIGELDDEAIHAAGGELGIAGPRGQRRLTTVHCLQGERLAELDEPLRARRCGFAEFHCMLVRTDALDRLGPLDEKLLSTREHEDFCMSVHGRGGEIWFEPASVVSYLPPPRRPGAPPRLGPPLRWSDLAFHTQRWSEAWNRRSLEHFVQKHGIEPSYALRVGAMNSQRQALFAPMRRVLRRTFGTRIENGVAAGLYRAERVVNRALYRS